MDGNDMAVMGKKHKNERILTMQVLIILIFIFIFIIIELLHFNDIFTDFSIVLC